MVYTYNIGHYDSLRVKHVMTVPPEIDAYFFVERAQASDDVVDADPVAANRSSVLSEWRAHGWYVIQLSMQPATPFLSSGRFTSKVLKFAPPASLLEGRQWVVSFDADIYIRLRDLPLFL